ncbi:hypothetical protein GCM10009789_43770 [Kribbella sancticallisti]|uniref:Glycoside hydrolase family 42 N-terminal domain-containing protein n=1 Tax=Kribbella sancticallisti TaxID=460087 RepID=A0ABN2DSI1_9ACTN
MKHPLRRQIIPMITFALVMAMIIAAQAAPAASARPLIGGTAASQVEASSSAAPMLLPKTRQKGIIPPGGIKASKTGGNTIDAELRESQPRADGYRHYDSAKLIERLTAMNANTYLFGIWEAPTDWDDLRTEFAPRARAAGIDIWVDVVPPSECQTNRGAAYLEGYCSRPYKMDYIGWARAIANLSLEFPNVKAWQIDDFLVAQNSDLFTPTYLGQIKATQDAINPNLGFLTTMYLGDYTDEHLDKLAPYIDGTLLPYLGGSQSTSDPRFVESQLNSLLAKLSPRNLDLILLTYTDRFLDASVPPSPEYVAEVLRRAAPYAAANQIGGVVAYGAPVNYDRRPTISSNNLANTGFGRLSFAQGNWTSAAAGEYAEAYQQVSVIPDAVDHKLSFTTFDQVSRTPSKAGKLIKEVLVDDIPVWRSDIVDEFGFTWVPTHLSLHSVLKGKTSAKLSLRLYTAAATGHLPIDVGFDSLKPTGFTVHNPGFEDNNPATRDWQFRQASRTLYGSFERWTDHQAKDIFDVIAAHFGGQPAPGIPTTSNLPILTIPAAGQEYWPGGRGTIPNSAMYGKGRLSLFVPERTATSTSSCVWAEQRVSVTPGLPRYELSWWDSDQYVGSLGGYHYKQVSLVTSKGKNLISNMDVAHDVNMWQNGQVLWGPIDITEFVQGESEVLLLFALCELQGVGDYMIDVGFDEIESVGLNIVNGNFEQGTTGWTIVDPHPAMHAQVLMTR